MMRLEDDGHCFVCGPENPSGLRLGFTSFPGGVRAVFRAEKRHQGYKDVVHGGIISALLDEAMVKAAIEAGFVPVTAELSVRFKGSLMVGEEAAVEAKVDRAGRFIEASAVMTKTSDGTTVATASAKLLQKRP